MPATGKQLAKTVADACAARDLDSTGARLIHHYANAVFVLPAHAAVARVASPTVSLQRVELTRQVTHWLTHTQSFAATAPLPGIAPVVVNGAAVSFWRFYPQTADQPSLISAHLGRLLGRLHRLESPPLRLDRWAPLRSLAAVLATIETDVLTESERSWLIHRVAEVQDEVASLDWPLEPGLIHGDAWAGNLLWDSAYATGPRPILGDWDSTGLGPREVDLIPTWHAGVRYGRGVGWIGDFVEAYGWDLARWSGFPVLFAMRDLVQLPGPLRRAQSDSQYAAAFRQRFEAIRAGDLSSTWVAL